MTDHGFVNGNGSPNGHVNRVGGLDDLMAGAVSPPAPPRRLKPIDSATLNDADYRREWLIEGVVARGQPVILGGPRKSLKTNILIDLAVSLGRGAAPRTSIRRPPPRPPAEFLGRFEVPRPVRVAVFSGESGEATIQETAWRVCRSKGISLEDVGVDWFFDLPRLSRAEDLAELGDLVRTHGYGAVILDPLYLCIGTSGEGVQAGNLFDMGPRLTDVSRTCLDAGATPILAHHSKKFRETADRYEPLEMEELAYAGVQEFARQWLLVSRREKYDPETGSHRLWLNVGGSAGFSGLYAVDVDEGLVDEDFEGRRWDVTVVPGGQARRQAAAAKEQRKQAEKSAETSSIRARIIADLGRPEHQAGDTLTSLATLVGKSKAEYIRPVVEGMAAEGLLVTAKVTKGKRTCDGYRLAATPAGPALPP